MITQKQDMEDVFSIFHDGVVEEYEIERENLTLKVYCQYLAELINPSYDFFLVQLNQLKSISLMPWKKDSQEEIFWTNTELIFQKGLEILSAKITSEDKIQVFCDYGDRLDDNAIYAGGTLEFDCNSIRIFDEEKKEISLNFLKEIATKYWGKFSE